MGQHEPGKHSKKGKAKAAESPRMPKAKKAAKVPPAGTVYGGGKKKGIISRLLGK